MKIILFCLKNMLILFVSKFKNGLLQKKLFLLAICQLPIYIYIVFERSLHFFIKNNDSNIVKYYYLLFICINIFSNAIYSCDGKAEFSASLLQSSVSYDPSEIILICWFDAKKINNNNNKNKYIYIYIYIHTYWNFHYSQGLKLWVITNHNTVST